jgi:hypothetical protein
MSEADINKMMAKAIQKRAKKQAMEAIETQVYMMAKVTRFIKYNRNLLHLDLT